MTGRRSRRGRRAQVAAALVAAVVLPLAPVAVPSASAHPGDPQVVTRVETIEPELPAGVAVEAVTSVAEQLVAQNPTDTELEILDRSGRPFLRISSAGVLADLSRPDWYLSNSPTGVTTVPEAVRADPEGAPRWARVSRDPSWGWFDHRLHEEPVQVPPEVRERQQESVLARFEVPLRYGGRDVTAAGMITFVPNLGAFLAELDRVPEGITVGVLQGPAPGLFLRRTGGAPVTVRGRDGEEFLRLDDSGAWVNVASATHRSDQLARGLSVPEAEVGSAPTFARVATNGASYSWLDDRLAHPEGEPPPDVLAAKEPAVVGEWTVPMTVGGTPGSVTGTVRWEPAEPPDQAQTVSGGGASTTVLVGLAALAGVVLIGLAVVGRRRRPA